MNRRAFLALGASILAAPAIVRATSLMPVSAIKPPLMFQGVPIEYDSVFRWMVPKRTLVTLPWKGEWSTAYVDLYGGDPIPTSCPHTQAAIDYMKART